MDSAPVDILSSPLSSPVDTCMSFCSFGSVDHESSVLAMAILAGNVAEITSLINVVVGAVSLDTVTGLHAGGRYGAYTVGKQPQSDHSGKRPFYFALCTTNAECPWKGGYCVRATGVWHRPFRTGSSGRECTAYSRRDPRGCRVGSSPSSARSRLEVRNHYGDTALVTAVLSQNHNAARMLLEVGADPNAQGEFGSTAVECASRRHDADMVDLLAEFGAKLVDEDEEMW